MKASGAISIACLSNMRRCDRSRAGRTGRRRAGEGTGRPSRQVAGQEAEPLAGLHRRPRQDDALDRVALERVDRHRHRQVGLAGAGGPDRRSVCRATRCCAGTRAGAACAPAGRCGACAAPARRCRRPAAARARRRLQFDQPELHFVQRQRVLGACVEVLQRGGCAARRRRGSLDAEGRAAPRDANVEGLLDLAQVLVERAAQVGKAAVVGDIRGELDRAAFQVDGLGRVTVTQVAARTLLRPRL